MKKSRFVIEVSDYPVEGCNLWFSTATGKMTIVSDETKKALSNKEGNEIIDRLAKMKFVVPDDFDEKKWAKHIYNSVNYADANLGLTITPTMKCNFKCTYCCECDDAKINDMSMETAEDIIKWVTKMVEVHRYKRVEVQYFGGEPTLKREIFEYLAQNMRDLSQKYNFNLKSYVVTNGYFEKELIDRMLDWGIKNIQFTIDGLETAQNSRKPLMTGEGTFDVVYRNFLYCAKMAERFEEVNLRINIDESNSADVVPLLDKVKNDVGDVSLVTVDLNETNWRGKKDSEYTSVREFIVETNKYAIRQGFKYDFHQGHFDSCNYSKINNIVIGADGNVYKCLMMVNEEAFKVTNIKDYYNSLEMVEFTGYEVDETCFECKYCPMCFGGCKAAAFANTGDKNNKSCRRIYFDRFLQDHLKLYYMSLIKERNEDR